MLFSLVLACTSTQPGDTADSAVWPPLAPDNGLQLVLDDVVLGPGEELERCRPMQLDAPGGVITRIELFAAEGLHHAFVTKGGDAEMDGEEPCFGLPSTAMEGYSVPEPLFASSTQVQHEVVDFPDGVGVELSDDPSFVFNYHLLNYTEGDQQAEVYLNLHYADDDAGMEKAGLYVMGNIGDLIVPAGGTAELITTCPFPEDVEVFSLTPHMHQLGTGFSAEVTHTGQSLLQTDSWDAPSSVYLDPVMAFDEGQGMTLSCRWQNPGETPVRFGSESGDEMCFLFGYHWPAEGFRFLTEYTGCTVEQAM